MKTGIELIYDERDEQINKHNFHALRDDEYINAELQMAAEATLEGDDGDFPAGWDLVMVQKICDKPELQRKIISGAFYMAEIARIERRVLEIAAEIDRLQNTK